MSGVVEKCIFCFEPISDHTPTELASCEADLKEAMEAEEVWGDDISIF
jgi:hypothetical protein